MAIDVRSLRYFSAIAHAGSITRAAQQLHIAQPALSSAVKALESELGVMLLDRSARGVQLTPAGVRLLGHAQDILNRLQVACDDVRELGSEPMGRVCIGMPQSMGLVLTGPLVTECIRQWPRIQLQVMEMATGHVPAALADRFLDLGIVYLKESGQELEYADLVSEELVLVGPPGRFPAFAPRQLRAAREFALADLADEPFVVPSPPHSLRRLIDRKAAEAQVRLRVVANVDAISQILSLVSGGIGHSILSYPAVVAQLEQGRVSVARLGDPRIVRTAYLCRSARNPPTAVVRLVESAVHRIVDDLVGQKMWPGLGRRVRAGGPRTAPA